MRESEISLQPGENQPEEAKQCLLQNPLGQELKALRTYEDGWGTGMKTV